MWSQDWPKEGQYVDFRDREHAWQVGLVVHKNQTHIKITNQGWGQHYDEILPLSDDVGLFKNPRLQPFRSNIRGSTSTRRSLAIRERWKYSRVDHESRLQKFQDFIKNIKSHSPWEIIQFLRGQHYFYIDFLMSNVYTSLEDIVKVYDYFQKHIVFLESYFTAILEKGVEESFINQAKQCGQDEIWQHSYDNCYYELIQALYSISGLQERLTFFIKSNEKYIKEMVGMCEKHEHYISTQILTVKLYDSIMALINQTHKNLFSSMNQVKFPFAFGFSLFQLFQIVQNIFRLQGIKEQAAQSFEMVFSIIEKLVDEISPNDMKQVQIDRELEYLLIHMRSTATKYKKDGLIANWPEKTRIKICLLLLKCDKLQKKIRGINKLRDLAERITKQQFFNLSLQDFNEALHEYSILQELFVHNEHVQLFKKSLEFVNFLYKYDIIEVEDIIYVWNNSINKHPQIVTILLTLWIELANILQLSDLNLYIQTVLNYYEETKNKSQEFIDFFFDLILAVSSNNIKEPQYKSYETTNQKVNAIIKEMMAVSYEMLKKSIDQPYFPVLVSKYGSTIVDSLQHEKIIEKTFDSLTKKDEFKVGLQILHQIYLNQDRSSLFIPKDYAKQLLSCLKLPNIEKKDVESILDVLNSIINFYKHPLHPQEFQTLWVFFQSISPQWKSLFYQWILPQKMEQIHDTINFYVNGGFTSSLKMYILDNILTNQNFIDYSSLSKKELSMILLFFMEVNIQESRLEKISILEGYRFIYRVKTVELIHDDILWRIFEQCKQSDVIQYLNKYIVKMYFFLSSSLPLHLRKSRMDFIMEKIIQNIKEPKPKNTRILKNSLMLLRNIFEAVREEEVHFYSCQNQFKAYYTKIDIKYLGKYCKVQALENETIMQFKSRLSFILKTKLKSLKLMIKEENRWDEIDYAYKLYTVGILKKSLIQITTLDQQEETVSQFIASYIDEEIEILLINMLETDAIATEVYLVIEQLELKLDKGDILEKIDKILQSEEEDNRKSMSIEIYYHLLEVTIYYKLLESEKSSLLFVTTPSFQRILKFMRYQLKGQEQIHFLYKAISLLDKIIKKSHQTNETTNTMKLLQYIFIALLQTTKFIIKGPIEEEEVKKYLVKIAHSSIMIIDRNVIDDCQLIDFYVQQQSFQELFQGLYLKSQVEEIRMLFTDKFKNRISLKGKPEQFHLSESAEIKLLSLFIDNIYFKIKEQQLNQSSGEAQNDAVVEFCGLLALLIENLSPKSFSQKQVMQSIPGKSFSLYEESLNFIQSLTLFTSADFHWNTLLIGHFRILSTIFKQRPALLTSDIINFALKNCLALRSQNTSQPLCKKGENVTEVFRFLDRILIFNQEIKYIKLIIETIKPCHCLQQWRIPASLSWNFNSKQEPKQAFRGLVNPGCICYMNSLLQQLFMIDDFRLSVLSFGKSEKMPQESESSSSVQAEKMIQEQFEGDSERLMLQSLKELFLKLQFSEENCINPSFFAKTLTTKDKKPMIKFNQQMDIDEFASIFFQKIEKAIKSQNSQNFITSLFGGVYAHQIISKECCHTSEREEQFISISLEVKENIIKSFESLVKTQILDGANKYHCEKCDKKVRAEKVQTIKQLPPYLILCLKRFEFDYDIDAKIKINDYCEFPLNLNLLEFSQQQILKAKSDLISEDDQNQSLPSQYFQYKLRGVVVHTGSADSGHYYSFIDNCKGTWHEFNDEQVVPFDLNRMTEQAFGCRSQRHDLKTKNAYLLLYERKNHKSVKKDQEDSILKREQHQIWIDKICKKNREIRKQEIIFSEHYESLISRIQLNLENIESTPDLKILWFQYELSFYFLVKARKDNTQGFLEYSNKIYTKINMDSQFCIFFLKIFTSPKFIEQFFVYNSVREKCKIVAYLVTTALENQYKRTKQKVSLEKNEIIFRFFTCLNSIFIYHSPIGELLFVIRKFLDLLLKQDNLSEIYGLIQNFNFCKTIFNSVFSIPLDKKTKASHEQYCKSNEWDINFLAPLSLVGRRLYSINYSEAWKITTIILNLCNQFIQKPEFQKLQKGDLYLNKMNYLKQIFKEVITQSKINSVIMESSSKKAIYYLYYSLKQLGFHLKIISCFDKVIKECDFLKYRPIFLYLEAAINDSEIETKEKAKILDLIQRGYKVNEKFFLETDIIHQWVLKFASQNEQFLDLLDSKRNFTQQIFDRISRNPYPTLSDLKNRFKHQITQRITNRLSGILISPDYKEYQINIHRMKKCYDEIINLNFTCREQYYPPSDNFQVGQTIQFFDAISMKWKKGTIAENILGHLKLHYDKDDLCHYLWEDSEKLRKFVPGRFIEPEPSPPQSDLSYQSSSSSNNRK